MTEYEIVKYLDNIEDKYPVNIWKVEDRFVWPYIKMVLCSYLSSPPIPFCDNSYLKKEKVKAQVKKITDAFIHSYGINSIKGDVLVLHHNISRNIILGDGTRFDHNLDPFALLLQKNCEIKDLEIIGNSDHFPGFRKLFFVDGYADRAAINARISSCFHQSHVYLPRYDDCLYKLPKKLRSLLEERKLYLKIKKLNVLCSQIKAALRNGFRIAITEDGYNEWAIALFMACYDLGIPCMEVQHGVGPGAGHRWYTSWKRMPETGKRYEMLPDIYWCWSEKDKEVIDSWSQGRHLTFTGGRPVLLVLKELEKLTSAQNIHLNSKKRTILLSLQPEVEYKEWLTGVIRETHDQYNWVVRKHPSIDIKQKQLIEKLRGLNDVYIEGMDSVLLESLLMKTHLHITDHSSVVEDALLYHIPSIVMGTEYAGLFQDEIEAGRVILCDNKEKMKKAIQKLIKQDRPEKRSFDNSADRARSFLLSQMGKGQPEG